MPVMNLQLGHFVRKTYVGVCSSYLRLNFQVGDAHVESGCDAFNEPNQN